MKDILEYIDMLEDRYKTLTRLIDIIMEDNINLNDLVLNLEERIRKLESK